MDSPPDAKDSKRITEHLSNERTYLAWLRTSFSLLTLGFATSKFGQFLVELRVKSDRALPSGYPTGSRRFGIGMVVLGTALIAVSTWNYRKTMKQIKQGTFEASTFLVFFVGAMSVSFGLVAIILLLEA
jgi:putative membrane protein